MVYLILLYTIANELNLTYDSDSYWKERDTTELLVEVKEGSVHYASGWYDLYTTEAFEIYDKLVKLGKKPYITMFAGDHLHLSTASLGFLKTGNLIFIINITTLKTWSLILFF